MLFPPPSISAFGDIKIKEGKRGGGEEGRREKKHHNNEVYVAMLLYQ